MPGKKRRDTQEQPDNQRQSTQEARSVLADLRTNGDREAPANPEHSRVGVTVRERDLGSQLAEIEPLSYLPPDQMRRELGLRIKPPLERQRLGAKLKELKESLDNIEKRILEDEKQNKEVKEFLDNIEKRIVKAEQQRGARLKEVEEFLDNIGKRIEKPLKISSSERESDLGSQLAEIEPPSYLSLYQRTANLEIQIWGAPRQGSFTQRADQIRKELGLRIKPPLEKQRLGAKLKEAEEFLGDIEKRIMKAEKQLKISSSDNLYYYARIQSIVTVLGLKIQGENLDQQLTAVERWLQWHMQDAADEEKGEPATIVQRIASLEQQMQGYPFPQLSLVYRICKIAKELGFERQPLQLTEIEKFQGEIIERIVRAEEQLKISSPGNLPDNNRMRRVLDRTVERMEARIEGTNLHTQLESVEALLKGNEPERRSRPERFF